MQVLIHFFAKLLYFLPFLGQNERDPVEKQPDRKIRKSRKIRNLRNVRNVRKI